MVSVVFVHNIVSVLAKSIFLCSSIFDRLLRSEARTQSRILMTKDGASVLLSAGSRIKEGIWMIKDADCERTSWSDSSSRNTSLYIYCIFIYLDLQAYFPDDYGAIFVCSELSFLTLASSWGKYAAQNLLHVAALCNLCSDRHLPVADSQSADS